jgi:hypothetical protein
MKTGRFAFWLSLLFSIILMINMLPCAIYANAHAEETPALSPTPDFSSGEYAITTGSLKEADAKANYFETLKVVNGAEPYNYKWSIKKGFKLPSPLSLKTSKDDASIGIISGKPSKPGDFPFIVQVTDSQNNVAEQSFTLHINPAVSFSYLPPLPASEVGVDFPDWKPTASGGNGIYTWSLAKGVLPKGLNLNTATGAISGNPQESGTCKFTLAVTDTLLGTAGKALAIKVYPAMEITNVSLPPADIGVTYKTTTLKSTGGAKQKTWSIVEGTLPDSTGLSMNNKGVFKGKPLPGSSRVYDLTVQVSDGIGVAEKDFSITINGMLTISPLPDGFKDRPYSWDLSATGGSGGYTFKIVGSLPSWLKYTASTATISGTPLTAGTYDIKIKLTDSLKGTVTSILPLTVKEISGDTQKPAVVSVTPKQNAANVAADVSVSAVFSEKMNASSINTGSFTLKQGNTAIMGTVTYDSTEKKAVFTPSEYLASKSDYTATLTTGVKDESGNSLAVDYIWSFTTVTLPEVVSVTPLNNAAGILRSTTIEAVFSKDMNVSTITSNNFTLKQGDTEIQGIVIYNKQNRTAIFSPSAALSPNTLYKATLTKAIKDSADNPLAADYGWQFTTGTDLISVSIDAPPQVAANAPFTLELKIDVRNLYAYQVQISYDDTVIQLVDSNEVPGVEDGQIGPDTIPVHMWDYVNGPGTLRILGSLNGTSTVSGQGYLVKLHFKATGSAGQSSHLSFTNGEHFINQLIDSNGLVLNCAWQNGSIAIAP